MGELPPPNPHQNGIHDSNLGFNPYINHASTSNQQAPQSTWGEQMSPAQYSNNINPSNSYDSGSHDQGYHHMYSQPGMDQSPHQPSSNPNFNPSLSGASGSHNYPINSNGYNGYTHTADPNFSFPPLHQMPDQSASGSFQDPNRTAEHPANPSFNGNPTRNYNSGPNYFQPNPSQMQPQFPHMNQNFYGVSSHGQVHDFNSVQTAPVMAAPSMNMDRDVNGNHSRVIKTGSEDSSVTNERLQAPLFGFTEKTIRSQRRKQSNRESAKRSRLRKQAECEELSQKIEDMEEENTWLREQVEKVKQQSEHIESQNNELEEKLRSIPK